MIKYRFYYIIIILLCIASKSHAQWETSFSHYWEVIGYYNPSFAGQTDNVRSAALYQLQHTDLNNAPSKDFSQRFAITVDMPFQFMQRKHGAGIIAYTESYGTLRNSLIAAQYCFKQQLGRGTFNIALQAGVYNLSYQVADLNAGISWIGSRSFAGLSLMHFNRPGFYIDSTRSHIPITYNFIAGYNIALFNSLEIQPMVWLLHDQNQTRTQATVRLDYDKRFSGGFSLISDNGYSIFAGAMIQNLRFGYAYSAYNKGVWKDSKGNHEMFLRYDFTLDSFKPKKQPHKSIRLL